jgi:2-desacetyl-2-hydroxyethyl bacteriochlorophyllide A dehydrogenase
VQFSAPGEVDVITEPLPGVGPEQVRVRTQYSAISPGTERLVLEGNAPEALAADDSIDALQDDDFSYPISYGYACAGVVEAVGKDVPDDWEGEAVFSFQPHVSHFVASPSTLVRLPGPVDLTDAVMIPSLETAVNLVMDGRPMIGETVVVFGQGIVGLLTSCLLAEHPLGALYAVEPAASRRKVASSLGGEAVASTAELGVSGDEGLEGADLIYELTGQPSVLNDAIPRSRFSGRIVVGSWYGTKSAPIDLGATFHRSRTQIISSQVSTIAPSLRGRWTKDRRMSVVIDLLSEIVPSRLISHRFPVTDASSAYDRLRNDPSMLQPIFEYE